MPRAALFGILLLSLAFGQQKPDLTGSWDLNLQRGDFAKEAPPKSMLYRFEQNDPELLLEIAVESPQGPMAAKFRYRTDGTEVTNDVLGNPFKAVAKWDEATLVMESWGKFGDNEVRLKDRYSLSEDRETVTLNRHYEGRNGPQDQKLIFEKAKNNK